LRLAAASSKLRYNNTKLTCYSGEKLTIKASGNFKDKVEKGFKMHLQVKYGLITLINQEADGCDTIGKADLECPLDKGEMTLTKDVDLPREIPPVRTVIASISRMMKANTTTGHIHRPRRRLHRRRRQDHLLDCQDRLPPVNCLYDARPRLDSTRILIRCRNSAGAEDEKPKENIMKLGQPRVKISGPMADMIQERLRKRNEL
jgi:hypothetical protein